MVLVFLVVVVGKRGFVLFCGIAGLGLGRRRLGWGKDWHTKCGIWEAGKGKKGKKQTKKHILNSLAISGNAEAIMVVSSACRVKGRNIARMILVRYTRRRFLAAFCSAVSARFLA